MVRAWVSLVVVVMLGAAGCVSASSAERACGLLQGAPGANPAFEHEVRNDALPEPRAMDWLAVDGQQLWGSGRVHVTVGAASRPIGADTIRPVVDSVAWRTLDNETSILAIQVQTVALNESDDEARDWRVLVNLTEPRPPQPFAVAACLEPATGLPSTWMMAWFHGSIK